MFSIESIIEAINLMISFLLFTMNCPFDRLKHISTFITEFCLVKLVLT